nr:transposase, MuDR, MULE transposase domain protein [Tanacetum cinerariifolium]
MALKILNERHEDSFSWLSHYCYKLKLANEGTVTHIHTDVDGRFEMLYVGFGCAIRSFLRYMRPLIIIDGVHLKGNYLGTNLLDVGMDANNQILPLSTGVSQGETGESWTWFLTKLKEKIGEPPNLCIILDRHAAIIQAPKNELSDWAVVKVYDKMLKSANWTVRPIDHLKLFQVFNKREVHQVDLVAFQCSCRKWQLSGLPCGHVCGVCRVSAARMDEERLRNAGVYMDWDDVQAIQEPVITEGMEVEDWQAMQWRLDSYNSCINFLSQAENDNYYQLQPHSSIQRNNQQSQPESFINYHFFHLDDM